MTHTPLTPTTSLKYYSAHRGPVWGPDGEFHHFARYVDQIHVQNGFWKFCSYEDDQRAYSRGLMNPEAVLVAQDVGDGNYDDIMLRWVPGELDPSNKPTVGTAAAHLETIYSERRVLGKSLSFRGRVPLYLISTDQRLLNYRLRKYGVQKDGLPDKILVLSSQHLFSNKLAPPFSTPDTGADNYQNQVPQPTSTQAKTPPPSELQTIHPNRAADPSSSPQIGQSHMQANVSSLLARDNSVSLHSLIGGQRRSPLAPTSSPPHPRPEGPSTSPVQSQNIAHSPPPSPATVYNRSRNQGQVWYIEDTRSERGIYGDADETNGCISIPSHTGLTPSQLFDVQSEALPCMDCEVVGIHESHCWIGEATLNLKLAKELTILDYRQLTEAVERFDPGPWTTHVGLSEKAEPDDPISQVRGMAEVIRNLDTTAEDPELRTLDDQFTVLLWAFKTSGSVQVLKGAHSNSEIRESYYDGHEVLDWLEEDN